MFCPVLQDPNMSEPGALKPHSWRRFACRLTFSLFKGRLRGQRSKREASELLRVIIWWLMVGGCQVRRDKRRQARITLPYWFAVYLSGFLCLTTSSLTYLQSSTSSVLALVYTPFLGAECPPNHCKLAAYKNLVLDGSSHMCDLHRLDQAGIWRRMKLFSKWQMTLLFRPEREGHWSFREPEDRRVWTHLETYSDSDQLQAFLFFFNHPEWAETGSGPG